MSQGEKPKKNYQTSLIFSFERGGLKKEFKFNVDGENLEDIKNNAIALQKEINSRIYKGQSPEIKTIRFEYGDEILV